MMKTNVIAMAGKLTKALWIANCAVLAWIGWTMWEINGWLQIIADLK